MKLSYLAGPGFFLFAALASLGLPSLAAQSPEKAIATLHPTAASNVHGVVTFTQSGDSTKIVADLTGLTPGKHGFHIHEYGDCSAPDAKSAGGHFNPTHAAHAGHNSGQRHVGDLGNIVADASGKAHLELHDNLIRLSGEHSIIGRAVIVHAKADDLHSQPSGDAGGRVACGVVGIAQP